MSNDYKYSRIQIIEEMKMDIFYASRLLKKGYMTEEEHLLYSKLKLILSEYLEKLELIK